VCSNANSQLIVGGIGDDISTALNSNSFDINTNEDDLDFPAQVLDPSCGRSNPARVWGAMLDGTYDSILSYAEQANAVGAENQAMEGASMLSGFYNQASALSPFLRQSQSSRAIILMGHADMCTSQQQKSVGSCQTADMDPQNYCRTTPQAFEREFRRGLDQLITLNNVQIIVFAPLRYSQICNFQRRGHTTESLYGSRRQCGEFWKDMAGGTPFGFAPCASLTADCSRQRIRDAYNTQLNYFNILQTVTSQYSSLVPGSLTPSAAGYQGGLVVGNGTKVSFRPDLWNYEFQDEDISSCDCFHPTKLMQSRIANITSGSLQCSPATPCCDTRSPEDCRTDDTIGGAPALSTSLMLGFCLLLFLRLIQ